MAINLPSDARSGDLARCVTHEANDEWPVLLEVVAYFGKEGRKGRRVSVEISPDQFYGRKGYGAPMSGDELIRIVDQLRRQR